MELDTEFFNGIYEKLQQIRAIFKLEALDLNIFFADASLL